MLNRNGYSYDDLTKSQRHFVDGMIAMREEVESGCCYVADESDDTLERIRAEVEGDVREKIVMDMDSSIADAIVSFSDRNSCAVEQMSRKAAEKKFGKRFVEEVLG